jgi:hypothetical protein
MTPVERRHPLAAVGVGSIAGAAAAAGMGALVHDWIAARQPPDIGPTAATLDDVFGTFLYGVVPALFAASLLTGLIARAPVASFGAALGAVVVLSGVGAVFAAVDWPAAVLLLVTGSVVGAFGAAAAALPLVLRGGVR